MDYIFYSLFDINMFSLFIILVALAFIYFNLSGRIKRLEENGSPYRPTAPQAVSGGMVAPTPSAYGIPAISIPHPSYAPITPASPGWMSQLGAWIKEDWLMKIGGLLILLGFVWFVSYAMLEGWISQNGRILIGLLFGAAVIALGFRRIQSFANQGSVFITLGAAVIHLTVFVARTEYNMFEPIVALGIMFLASAFVALAAVRFRVRMLAFSGLALAGVVPLLVHSGTNYVGLFSYLAIIVVGTLWVVLLTEWRDLLVGALAILSLYSAPHWTGMERVDMDILLLFAYGFAAIFFSANIVGFIRSRIVSQATIVAAAWNGFFLLSWILVGVAEEWQVLVLSFWTVVFLGAAFGVYRATGKRAPFFSYAAVGIAFLGTATGIQLHGVELGIAYTLEVAGVVALSHYLVGDRRSTKIASLLFFIPGMFVLESMAEYPSYAYNYGMNGYGARAIQYGNYAPNVSTPPSLFNEHFFLILLFALVLQGLGVFLRRTATDEEVASGGKFENIVKALSVVGSVVGFILLWLFTHHAFEGGVATMISLAVYTAIGIKMYFMGRERGQRALKLYGEVLLGFVVVHLLFVDVWELELLLRVITFMLVGALLMATAFRAKKQKETSQ